MLDARLGSEPFCHLTTIGRRTGASRRIEIWFAAAGTTPETIYLLAGGRERAGWVRNLRARAEVSVEIGARRFAGIARVLAPGLEDATARRLVYEKYRTAEDDLEEWRDSALPIAIDLRRRISSGSRRTRTTSTGSDCRRPGR